MSTTERLPYIVLLITATVACGAIAFRAYKARRKVARANSFTLMAVGGSFWMLLILLDLLSTNLFWKQVWWSLIPFAIFNTLMALMFFSLEYSLRLKRVPRWIILVFGGATLMITALACTNELHHQYWSVMELNGTYLQVMGSLFNLQLGYTYLLSLASLVLLVRAHLQATGVLRRQTELMLIGLLIPILISVASDVFGWNPLPYIDEPALSIVFSVALFGWATLRFNVFYLLPVASDVIIRNMQNGVLVTDVDGMVILTNPAILRELGKSGQQFIGQPVAELLAGWLPEASQAWIEGKQDSQLVTLEASPRYFHMSISPLAGNSGDVIGSLLTLHDVSEQKNYENRLRELAISDPLTGCYNRRYFYEMAHTYFDQMRRSARPLSILMLDLDHFKTVNDTYGHVQGDRVLQKVAAVCKIRLRVSDIFARYGGEEFILAMPETDAREAMAVAERLRVAIEQLVIEPDQISVTASIGIAESTLEPGLSFDDLLKRADEAMYHSKRTGRNRVTHWADLGS